MGTFKVTGASAIAHYSGEFVTLVLGGEGRESVTVEIPAGVAREMVAELAVELDTARRIKAGTAEKITDRRTPVADVRADLDKRAERPRLPEDVRDALFAALGDGTAELTEITRADTGFKFTARVGDLVAYGAVVRRTSVVIAMVHRVDGDVAYEPWGGLIEHAEATADERVAILARCSEILRPRWAEFGTIGTGKAVHVRENRSTGTLCGRGTAAGWLDKSEWSQGRCVRCNAALDKRTAE